MGMFGGMQMNKTRLIDILNLIAKGELEEGTKIKIGREIYSWNTGIMKNAFESEYDTYLDPMCCLDAEVEIIGKDTNVATKIEEINTEFLRYTFECEGTFRPVKAITSLGDKLNEVIRELNRRSE